MRRGFLRAALLLVVALGATPALAERLGDFGRAPTRHADPDYRSTRHLDRPDRPSLLLTDEEQEMTDRIWRFLLLPDGKPWQVRSRRAPPVTAPPERYFQWLKSDRFESSHTRFSAIAEDVEADLGTLPSTFEAICIVRDLDDRRQVALAGLSIDRASAQGVALRRAENEGAIADFVGALVLREASYAHALDHLLAETPHAEARAADAALADLAPWVAAARRGDFCGHAGGLVVDARDAILPGRVLMGDHERVVQK